MKCLKHRETGMINIKRKHVLCKKHDISHSKKSSCRICKLDIDNYDSSSKYMKDKIYKQFKKKLIEKIKKKFKKHPYKEILRNILNNSKDKTILEERKKLKEKRKKKNKNKRNSKNYICKICDKELNVDNNYFESKEHINNSNKNIEIRTKKSIEEKFIDIIFKFKITTKDAFYNDLYLKKVAKQKVRKDMIKDKKYKYNITFHNGVLNNIDNKLTNYETSYNPEDIFESIDTAFSDMHMLNSTDVKDANNNKTDFMEKEIVKKDREKLRVNKIISKQNEEKLLEENKKLMETIKKVEHAEIKEWLLEQGVNENEITDKFIQEQRKDYFDYIYGNASVSREYNNDGTFELVRDYTENFETYDITGKPKKNKTHKERNIKHDRI